MKKLIRKTWAVLKGVATFIRVLIFLALVLPFGWIIVPIGLVLVVLVLAAGALGFLMLWLFIKWIEHLAHS